jgi:ribose/xylose/arabinose/galactoside ABC-type transport system permease subunit
MRFQIGLFNQSVALTIAAIAQTLVVVSGAIDLGGSRGGHRPALVGHG